MKNRKKMIVLIVQILAVLIFVFSYKSYTDSVLKPVKVYTWAREIGEGVQIKATDIIEGEVSSSNYQTNMILTSDAKSIIGSYTTTTIYPDTYVYYRQVGDVGTQTAALSNLDLTNSVQISIPCDLTSDAGGNIREGDTIDLLYTAQGTSTILNKISSEGGDTGNSNLTSESSFVYSKVFMNDITVYKTLTNQGYKTDTRADRYSGEDVAGIDNMDGTITADSGTVGILVLITTPEQAEEIYARQAQGEITVLKRFDETETHETLGYVMGNYGKVFAGNANAETGSLQILSTIQDTDENTENGASSLQEDEVLTSAEAGNMNTDEEATENENGNVEAVIGTETLD